MSNTIELIREGQTGDGSDPLSGAIERLRTSGCSDQYQVFADYSSTQTMAEQLGADTCSDLEEYVAPEAVRLLREDGLCTGGQGTQSADEAQDDEWLMRDGLPWNEAFANVGSSMRVCGPLAGTGGSSDDVFLNIGRDYPDPARFTIVLWDVGGVEPLAPGTTLCAAGLITSYEGVAQIQLRSASDVEVAD